MIVILPVLGVLFAAFYSKRYVKDVADYLACGRVAGRYVISVGDMAAGLSVISLVAACEANYQVGIAFVAVSKPFNPWIVWEMNPIKFPVNSIEISFIAMMLGIVGYLLGSLITYREPFNLDRLLHRGKYHPDGEQPVVVEKLSVGSFIYRRMIGITPEYTRGDRLIAWSVFLWSIVYGFGIMFCGVLIWNKFSPWPVQRWGVYYYITTIVASLLVGCVSTVWFMWGGFRDMVAMFRDLAARVANPLDDGRVVGHVSLADKEHFEEVEETVKEDETEPKA